MTCLRIDHFVRKWSWDKIMGDYGLIIQKLIVFAERPALKFTNLQSVFSFFVKFSNNSNNYGAPGLARLDIKIH